MKALIQHDIVMDKVEIYVHSDDGRYHLQFDPEATLKPVWIERSESERTAPTLVLDSQMWAAIMKEAVGSFPIEDAVKDARQMRDRLLAMIEAEWKSRQLEAR